MNWISLRKVETLFHVDWGQLLELIRTGELDYHYEGGEDSEHLRVLEHQVARHFHRKSSSYSDELSDAGKAVLYSVLGAFAYSSLQRLSNEIASRRSQANSSDLSLRRDSKEIPSVRKNYSNPDDFLEEGGADWPLGWTHEFGRFEFFYVSCKPEFYPSSEYNPRSITSISEFRERSFEHPNRVSLRSKERFLRGEALTLRTAYGISRILCSLVQAKGFVCDPGSDVQIQLAVWHMPEFRKVFKELPPDRKKILQQCTNQPSSQGFHDLANGLPSTKSALNLIAVCLSERLVANAGNLDFEAYPSRRDMHKNTGTHRLRSAAFKIINL